MNAHLHNSLVNNSAYKKHKNKVNGVFDMLKEAIVLHKVRFFAGDANMGAYRLVPYLRSCGVEARLMDYHVELISAVQLSRRPEGPEGTPQDASQVLYDSMVIIAIGGLAYRPKLLLPECHMRMGAMVPCQTNKNNTRGYPAGSYLPESEFPYGHTSAPAEIVSEIREIEVLMVLGGKHH